MNIIPKDKFDLESVSNLDNYTNSELEPYISELLNWSQDMNWPVAKLISKRLSKSGMEIVEPIRKILMSNDNTWKYFLITGIIDNLDKKVINQFTNELTRIIENPTKSEIEEEINLVAKGVI